jgi:hypothetical protein
MTTEQLMGIVAIFVPLLVAVVKKSNFSATVNAAIAVVIYVVVGLGAVLVSGQPFTLDNILPSVATFTTVGTVAYQLFWKNWGDPQIVANVNS